MHGAFQNHERDVWTSSRRYQSRNDPSQRHHLVQESIWRTCTHGKEKEGPQDVPSSPGLGSPSCALLAERDDWM